MLCNKKISSMLLILQQDVLKVKLNNDEMNSLFKIDEGMFKNIKLLIIGVSESV